MFQSIRRTKREMVEGLSGEFTEAKMIGHSTLEYRRPDGTRVIRFHETDVVSIAPDGAVTLDSGGFQTATTKKRMNEYLPSGFGVYAEQGVWYVQQGWKAKERYVFCDGMTVAPDGTVTGSNPDEEKRVKDLQRKIRRYCNAMKKLDRLPRPDAGDCFLCRMPDPTCIESHLDETYIHGTLILNAMQANGCTGFIIAATFDPDNAGCFASTGKDYAIRATRKYLKKQLGLAG